MIKKITIVLLLYCVVISCGKKGDPEYKVSEKKTIIQENFINKI
tara:strand:- start:693 stop:824 length:132 start_codon:yes stop_codon:yes gene_type:complete